MRKQKKAFAIVANTFEIIQPKILILKSFDFVADAFAFVAAVFTPAFQLRWEGNQNALQSWLRN